MSDYRQRQVFYRDGMPKITIVSTKSGLLVFFPRETVEDDCVSRIRNGTRKFEEPIHRANSQEIFRLSGSGMVHLYPFKFKLEHY